MLIEEEERDRLQKKWVKLFGQGLGAHHTEAPTYRDETSQQYYFDT